MPMTEQLPLPYLCRGGGWLYEDHITGILAQHQGRDQAISMAALAERVGLSTRDVQHYIKHLIEHHGVLIGSATGKPHGYYLITEPSEVHAAIAQLQHRLISLAVRIARLNKTSVEVVFGQARLQFDEWPR